MASLLLIGGTGFFGKSFLDSFQRGKLNTWGVNKVIAMSRNANQLRSVAPNLISDQVELINADIASVNELPKADFVIHAAASTDARSYLNKPAEEAKNIDAGISNYVRLARKFHSKSKIVYTSSGAVYGSQNADVEFLREDAEFEPLETLQDAKKTYAVAKRNAERVFEGLRGDCKNAAIARCFAFVGRYLPLNTHFAVGNFIRDVIEKKPIEVKAKYSVFRSYMFADDLVHWLMTIANSSNYANETYNVGSSQSVLLHDLAIWMASEYNTNCKVQEIESNNIDRYIPSTEKALSQLGLELTYDLQDSIKETIRILGRK